MYFRKHSVLAVCVIALLFFSLPFAVKAGDGTYYKASDGPGGSIVLRPVDPNIAVAAAKTGLDVSGAISEAATEQYKLNVNALARKVAQGHVCASKVVMQIHAHFLAVNPTKDPNARVLNRLVNV